MFRLSLGRLEVHPWDDCPARPAKKCLRVLCLLFFRPQCQECQEKTPKMITSHDVLSLERRHFCWEPEKSVNNKDSSEAFHEFSEQCRPFIHHASTCGHTTHGHLFWLRRTQALAHARRMRWKRHLQCTYHITCDIRERKRKERTLYWAPVHLCEAYL